MGEAKYIAPDKKQTRVRASVPSLREEGSGIPLGAAERLKLKALLCEGGRKFSPPSERK